MVLASCPAQASSCTLSVVTVLVQGNLSEFVKRVPEAQAYYNLEAASTKFAFPEPGFLEGIKTKDKAILKMARVGFT